MVITSMSSGNAWRRGLRRLAAHFVFASIIAGGGWATPVAAQGGGGVAGRVVTASGTPVAAAGLVLLPGQRTSESDSLGRFRFDAVPAGEYRLVVTHPRFRSMRVAVGVRDGETTTRVVTLVEAPTRLGAVRTTASRPGGSVSHADPVANGIIYAGTKNEVVQVAGLPANLAEKTGRQLFSHVPGAFIYDMDGSGNQVNFATRGLDAHRSWEFNVRQDGILLNSDMYGYPASHYSPPMEAIERIELTRGTAALQYGSQFGGLLNYVTKRPPSDRPLSFESISSAGAFGLRSTFNSIGGTVDRLSYYGYMSIRKSDGYRANGTSDANAQMLGVTYEASPSLKVRARVGRSTYLYRMPGPLTDAQFEANPRQATRSRNYFSPDIVVPSVAIEWGDSTGLRGVTTVSGVFGPRNSVQFLAFANQPDLPDATGQYAVRQVDQDHFRSLATETRITRPWSWLGSEQVLAFGVALASNRLHRQQQGVGTRGTDYDLTVTAAGFQRDITYRTENGAFYVENLFRLTPRWSVVPGMRVEVGRTRMEGRLAYYDPADTPRQIDHQYPLLGVRTTYRSAAGPEWYGGFSQAYRPQILKDVLPNSPLERTDPNIKDSRGWTLESGVRGTLGSRLSYDVSVFELRIGDRFGTVLQPSGTGSVLYRTNVGNSRTRGVELTADATLWESQGTSVHAFTATSLYDGRYRSGSVVSGGVNVDIEGNRIESVPAWISRSGIGVDTRRFSAQALLSYVGDSYADAVNTRTPSANGAVGLVPSYSLLDINGALRVTKWMRLRGGINNALDRQYFTKRPQFYPSPGVWPSDGRGVQASLELNF